MTPPARLLIRRRPLPRIPAARRCLIVLLPARRPARAPIPTAPTATVERLRLTAAARRCRPPAAVLRIPAVHPVATRQAAVRPPAAATSAARAMAAAPAMPWWNQLHARSDLLHSGPERLHARWVRFSGGRRRGVQVGDRLRRSGERSERSSALSAGQHCGRATCRRSLPPVPRRPIRGFDTGSARWRGPDQLYAAGGRQSLLEKLQEHNLTATKAHGVATRGLFLRQTNGQVVVHPEIGGTFLAAAASKIRIGPYLAAKGTSEPSTFTERVGT